MIGQDISIETCVSEGYCILEESDGEYRVTAYVPHILWQHIDSVPEEVDDAGSIDEINEILREACGNKRDAIMALDTRFTKDELLGAYLRNKHTIDSYTGHSIVDHHEWDEYDILHTAAALLSWGVLDQRSYYL